MADVRIGMVDTQVTITEPVGPLSREDVQRIARLVIEMLRDEDRGAVMRRHDTAVTDRAWRPPGE